MQSRIDPKTHLSQKPQYFIKRYPNLKHPKKEQTRMFTQRREKWLVKASL